MINFFNSFRGKLFIVLAFLLIATLSVQLYVNIKTENENAKQRAMQEQVLLSGIVLGFNGMQAKTDRLQDFVKREGLPFFNSDIAERIQEILVINDEWEVYDSLSDENLPSKNENGTWVNKKLKDLNDLPPILDASRLGEDAEQFPNAGKPRTPEMEGEARAIPIETNQGRWYVIVVLKTDDKLAFQKAIQPLVYTLLIFLISTAIAIVLVWRFTRPIANLSKAARRVAAGDLNVRVQDADRADEIGELAAQFNVMTAELEKSHELEAQLQQAEKSAVVGRLASAIAHEIRNPLNYINLTLDHLRAKFSPVEGEKRSDFEKLTNQLKTEVGRINLQVSDFLRYSRPVELVIRPTDVRNVIDESLRLIEPQAGEQNIKISVIEREGVDQIKGDREVLRSVFNNLFINAAQAMESLGGNLNVVISPAEDKVMIEIKDTGVGIRQENMDKIFEPYFSTKETGTGLGLAIVKKIIDDHKGSIDVESKENEGTVFTIKLPKQEFNQN